MFAYTRSVNRLTDRQGGCPPGAGPQVNGPGSRVGPGGARLALLVGMNALASRDPLPLPGHDDDGGLPRRVISLLFGVVALAVPGLAPANSLVIQVVDANVEPAVRVDLVEPTASAWTSDGSAMVLPGPTARLWSNVPYVLRDASELETDGALRPASVGVIVHRAAPSDLASPGEEPTSARGRDYASEISQLIDFGLPLLVDSTWRVTIQYTFVPSSV